MDQISSWGNSLPMSGASTVLEGTYLLTKLESSLATPKVLGQNSTSQSTDMDIHRNMLG